MAVGGASGAEASRDLTPVRTATSDAAASKADSRRGLRGELSNPAVGRLSLYFRELSRLLDDDIPSINSRDLAGLVNVSPAIVRRDLSAIGTIGRRGVGYDVRRLLERLGEVLGSGQQWKVILIGVGSLGTALLRYRGFTRLGFSLAAAFDTDASKVGQRVGGTEVLSVNELDLVLDRHQPELAVLAVPSDQALEMATRVVAGGIEGILNFAPITLRVGGKVAVVNVDLASELQQLAFRINQSARAES
ncbi:MAG: redox-sensing transcriptional repressor Rex [Planctomycetota bacterium]